MPNIREICNASQRIDQRFFKTSSQSAIFFYNMYLHQLPVELNENYNPLYSYKDIVLIPKYSEDIVCKGTKLVVVDEYCQRICCRGNYVVIVRKHGRRIYCYGNFLVCCSINCIKAILKNNFIQMAVLFQSYKKDHTV